MRRQALIYRIAAHFARNRLHNVRCCTNVAHDDADGTFCVQARSESKLREMDGRVAATSRDGESRDEKILFRNKTRERSRAGESIWTIRGRRLRGA
jgi:hypothetical protein